MAEGYQRQVRGSTVVLKPQRNPSSIAGALGKGLETLGATGVEMARRQDAVNQQLLDDQFEIQQIEKKRAQAAEVTRVYAEAAKIDETLATRRTQLPEYGAPGAAGYGQAWAKEVDQAYDGLADSIQDEEVRNRLLPDLERNRSRQKIAGQEYERTTRLAWQGDNVNTWLEARSANLMRNPSGATLDEDLASLGTMVEAMELDGRAGPKFMQIGKRQLAGGLLDGLLAKGDFGAVREVLGSGQLDGIFAQEELKQYGQLADNAEKAAERQAELEASAKRDAARESLKVLEARMGTDNPPSPTEWKAAIAAAGQAGVPQSELINYGTKAQEGIETQGVLKLPSPTLEQGIQDIKAKRDAGMATPADIRWLGAADKELAKRGGEAGQRIAPLLKGGPDQRMLGINQLAAMPMGDRWRAATAAGDPRAAWLAGLTPEARAWAVQGGMTRGARKEAYLPQGARFKNDQQRQAEVDRVARDWMGPDMWRQLGPNRAILIDVSMDLMAGRSDGWNKTQFQASLNMAMGGTVRSDGQWQGGLGTVYGRKVELPAAWTQGEFEQRYGRYGFEGAVNGNGTALQPADIRQNFQLRFVGQTPDGDSHYQLIGPDGRPLLRKTAKGKVEVYDLAVPGRP